MLTWKDYFVQQYWNLLSHSSPREIRESSNIQDISYYVVVTWIVTLLNYIDTLLIHSFIHHQIFNIYILLCGGHVDSHIIKLYWHIVDSFIHPSSNILYIYLLCSGHMDSHIIKLYWHIVDWFIHPSSNILYIYLLCGGHMDSHIIKLYWHIVDSFIHPSSNILYIYLLCGGHMDSHKKN